MMWVILSILAGLGDATKFLAMKKIKDLNLFFILSFQFLIALPFMLLMQISEGIPEIKKGFYLVLIINIILIALANIMIIKATQLSSLSSSIPMLSFTPAFLLFTSFLMLNEFPSFFGVMGIILIVVGAYIINIRKERTGFLGPILKISKDKGALLILGVAIIYSITANLSKIGVLSSGPIFFSTLTYLGISIIFIPIFFLNIKKNYKKVKVNLNRILLLGFSASIMVVSTHIAVKFAIVPYVISLKRFSVIFSILYGYYIFKEKNIRQSLLGASMMVFGGILITLL